MRETGGATETMIGVRVIYIYIYIYILVVGRYRR